MSDTSIFKAAAVQASPAFLDKAATVAKTIGLIDQAAARGVKLLAFPEAWIPGYPFWSWLGSQAWGMQFLARYHDNSVERDGPEIRAIAAAAAAHGMMVVLGTSERDHGTLYLGQTIISADGQIVAHRRKLRATHVERSVFGEGDGSDIAVHDTPLGRIGALCCWEHLQPLVKYTMYAQHEQVHVASWPCFSLYQGRAYALGPELNGAVNQVYAAEGQCFVIAATMVTTPDVQAIVCDTPDKCELLPLGGGASMIYGPDGQPLAASIPADQEGLVIAEIDLSAIVHAKSPADPVGHYARHDVFQLHFDNTRRRSIFPVDEDMATAELVPARHHQS